MSFEGEVNASSPLDFSESFSPQSAPLKRFPAKPSLCVCKQRATQKITVLKVPFGIFQHLSDLCWAQQTAIPAVYLAKTLSFHFPCGYLWYVYRKYIN